MEVLAGVLTGESNGGILQVGSAREEITMDRARTRGWAWAVVVGLIGASGCGPEIASTAVTGSMEGTSGEESEMSEADKTAWLVISGIVLALGVGLTVAALVDEASYIERHQRDIERGLAGGDGPFASDLAHALSLPETGVARVKALLRARRGSIGAELAKVRGLGRKVEPRDLGGFWREVLAALRADPILVPSLERLERRALELTAGGGPAF